MAFANMPRTFVAVDDGYAQLKLYGLGGNGIPTPLILPTAVRPGHNAVSGLEGGGGGWYESGGQRYSLGDHIVGEATRFSEFHTSVINRVAVHHILRRGGYGDRSVHLWVGLPVGDYYKDGVRNDDLIARKRQNLQQTVTVGGQQIGQGCAKILSVDIVPQAVASYFDYLIGADGTMPDTVPPVAVVDIGGRTTDCTVVLSGNEIDHARTGTDNIGALDVQQLLIDSIAARFGLDSVLPAAEYKRAMCNGEVKLFGQLHNVADLVAEAKAAIAESILRAVSRKIGKAAELDAVLFVGGGSLLFRDLVGAYPHGVLNDDAEVVNARGIYKFARLNGGHR